MAYLDDVILTPGEPFVIVMESKVDCSSMGLVLIDGYYENYLVVQWHHVVNVMPFNCGRLHGLDSWIANKVDAIRIGNDCSREMSMEFR